LTVKLTFIPPIPSNKSIIPSNRYVSPLQPYLYRPPPLSSDPQPSSCPRDDVSNYDDWGRWTNGIANAANGASNSDPVNVNGNGWISGNGVTPNKAINGNGQPQANGA